MFGWENFSPKRIEADEEAVAAKKETNRIMQLGEKAQREIKLRSEFRRLQLGRDRTLLESASPDQKALAFGVTEKEIAQEEALRENQYLDELVRSGRAASNQEALEIIKQSPEYQIKSEEQIAAEESILEEIGSVRQKIRNDELEEAEKMINEIPAEKLKIIRKYPDVFFYEIESKKLQYQRGGERGKADKLQEIEASVRGFSREVFVDLVKARAEREGERNLRLKERLSRLEETKIRYERLNIIPATTEQGIAQEEAIEEGRYLDELVRSKAVEDYAKAIKELQQEVACQPKTKEQIEIEEFSGPERMYLSREIASGNVEEAQKALAEFPPEIQAALKMQPGYLSLAIKTRKMECRRTGDKKGTNEIAALEWQIHSCDPATAQNVPLEVRQSPEYRQAAVNYLSETLVDVLKISGGERVYEYVWARNKFLDANVMVSQEVDKNEEIQGTMKKILVGEDPPSHLFLKERVDRFQRLRDEYAAYGIIDRGGINQAGEVRGVIREMLHKQFESSGRDEEKMENYLRMREQLFHLGIMRREETDWDKESEKDFRAILLKQFFSNLSNSEKIRRFLGLRKRMLDNNMLRGDMLVRFNRDLEIRGRLALALGEEIINPTFLKEERESRYQSLQNEVVASGIATAEEIESWPYVKNALSGAELGAAA